MGTFERHVGPYFLQMPVPIPDTLTEKSPACLISAPLTVAQIYLLFLQVTSLESQLIADTGYLGTGMWKRKFKSWPLGAHCQVGETDQMSSHRPGLDGEVLGVWERTREACNRRLPREGARVSLLLSRCRTGRGCPPQGGAVAVRDYPSALNSGFLQLS